MWSRKNLFEDSEGCCGERVGVGPMRRDRRIPAVAVTVEPTPPGPSPRRQRRSEFYMGSKVDGATAVLKSRRRREIYGQRNNRTFPP